MRTKPFGPIGRDVSVVGLGGMPLSLAGRPERDDAVRVIHAALDAGMTLIDTADVYCVDDADIGHNEQLIARALWSWSGDPDTILVCTKGGLRRPDGAWTRDARPAHLRDACDRSLSALGVDRVAVYQLHAPDPKVPLAESVGALARLREEGKIEHIGLSNVSVAEIEEAMSIAPIVSVQNRLNPFDRAPIDDGVLARCEEAGLAFLAYSPVGGGNGKVRTKDSKTLNDIAQAHGATPFQVAIAWCLAKSDAVFAIPGASRLESATSSAAAASLTLAPDELARIDADPR